MGDTTSPDEARGLLEHAVDAALRVHGVDGTTARIAAGRALTEMFQAMERGTEVRERRAWLWQVAQRRAQDLVRADGRFLDLVKRVEQQVVQRPQSVSEQIVAAERDEERTRVLRCLFAMLGPDDARRAWEAYRLLGEGARVGTVAHEVGFANGSNLKKFLGDVSGGVGELAVRVTRHSKLVPGSSELLVRLLEARVGVPEGAFSAEVARAADWADRHPDPSNDNADMVGRYLRNTWGKVAGGRGRVGRLTRAQRRLVAAAAAYVLLPDDVRPDEGPGGFRDDYWVLHAVRRAMGLKAMRAGGTLDPFLD